MKLGYTPNADTGGRLIEPPANPACVAFFAVKGWMPPDRRSGN
ncbi:hypothetical protein [Candidatus Pantoea floridensis]|uniref:Uncharacterized protein n=1 Tax=Candidatus Pantoea floridensis TaxID=1938870 RepID=A0A286DQ73_9GAMM|nr:hypothetical protein [Pantoea floridensis]PIF14923.1 hypothetical protein BX596_4027 [Enterobacteriaceae bacterium JKS000233]SOD60842.1 hypothetical protein SAMN06273570_4869 [Pantoea floridensis]